MADLSYIKLYHKILSWEWHDDPYTLSLFLHLLCMANYLPNYKFRGKVQRVGEVHTSAPQLAWYTGMHVNTVSDRLKRLQKTGEITVKPSNKGLDIYILKYAEYQSAYSDNTTPNVVRHVGQDVVCGVVQNVEQEENMASSMPSTTLDVSQDVLHHTQHHIESGAPCGQSIYNSFSINNTNTNNGESTKKVQYSASELEQQFDHFRKAYKGTKRGLAVELDNFKKKNSNWRELIPLLMPALERELTWREQMSAAGQFVPQWAYLQTWLNQRRWETEYESLQTAQQTNTTKAASQQAAVTDMPPSEDEYGGSFGGMDV